MSRRGNEEEGEKEEEKERQISHVTCTRASTGYKEKTKKRRRRGGRRQDEKGTDEGKMLWLNKPQDNLDGKGRYRKKNGVQSGTFGRERETGFKLMQEAQFSQLVR